MTKRQPKIQPVLKGRLDRAAAFAEVLIVSLVIQAAFNKVFELSGIDLRLAVYETALIWMFCK
jgi:hypothetical protein